MKLKFLWGWEELVSNLASLLLNFVRAFVLWEARKVACWHGAGVNHGERSARIRERVSWRLRVCQNTPPSSS